MDLAKYVGRQIKKLRTDAGLTQIQLAEKLGIKNSTIANYEAGYRSPKQDLLFALADVFNVSIDIFFPGIRGLEEETTITKTVQVMEQLHPHRQEKIYEYAKQEFKEQQQGENIKTLPFHPKPKPSGAINLDTPINVAGKLSAGHGARNYDKEKPIKTVSVDYVPAYYDLAFEIKGDSMSPYYSDGEIVFVQKTQDIHNGMLAAVEINNEAFIKKIYFDSNRLRLISLNIDKNEKGERLYPDFYADEFDNIHMIGRVIN